MIPLQRNRLNRRTFLRSATVGAGTLVSLPALEAMFPTDAAYAAGAAGKPRFLAIYVPNGHHHDRFYPSGSGSNLDLNGVSAKPLEPWKDKISLFKSMIGAQRLKDDPKGSKGNDHLVAIVSWLAANPVPSALDKTHTVTADTLLAKHYEKTAPNGRDSQHAVISGSPFVDPKSQNYNNEQKDWISSNEKGEKIFATINLQDVLDKIFTGGGAAPPAMPDPKVDARRELRKSALDAVNEDSKRLTARLGQADKDTLATYLESVFELEKKLTEGGEQVSVPAIECVKPTGPWSKNFPWPRDRKNDLQNKFIDEHWDDTMKLLAVAFQCEAVRSVAYMLETEAGESGYSNHGLSNSHALSHGVKPDYAKRDVVHNEIFAKQLKLFQDTKVGDSNLLDETLIYFGAGIGVEHSHERQGAVIAGWNANGNITHGKLHDFGNTKSSVPLLKTVLTHMGVIGEGDTFGDPEFQQLYDWS